MGKFWGKLGVAIARPLLHAVPLSLLIVFSAAVCHAQTNCTLTAAQANQTFQFTDIEPTTWPPGQSTVVTLTGSWTTPPTPLGCESDLIEVQGLAASGGGTGVPDPNVTISNIVYNPNLTQTTFTATVLSGAPYTLDLMSIACVGYCPNYSEIFVNVAIQTPPPPPPPPPPPSCPAQSIAGITPGVWYAGKTYNITIKGTNFVEPGCGSLDVQGSFYITDPMQAFTNAGNWLTFADNVVSATTITATVQVPANAPTEQATVWLFENCDPEADDGCPDNLPGYLTFPVNIVGVKVQAQNVTPTLSLPAEQVGIGTSAANTAHLTLGGTFQIGLGYQHPDGTFQALPSTFALGASSLSGDLDDSALFPDKAVFQYTDQAKDAVVLQATHLGTQPLTITPNDTSLEPLNITLSVEEPESLGNSHADLDSTLYPLADETGVPPQMIKGQVKTEGGFNPMAWRYEPLNATVGDFAYSRSPKDLRTNAHYGSSLRLPTIGDSVDPGNCGTDATLGNVKVIVKGVLSNRVSSLSPPSGAPGTQVTITGSDFGDSQAAVSGAVTVNGVNAVITSWSSTSIKAVVPDYDYTTHVDSRIPDPGCVGLAQGATFSPQVMNDLAQETPTLMIPQRDPTTGAPQTGSNGQPILRPMAASDRYVSVHDLFSFNDGNLNWGKNAKNPTRVAKVKNGTVDFSAQLSLAASYGLLQVTYATAIDLKWAGNTASCSATDPKDPDNLFDTRCNLANGGGSLGIGTRYTEGNFASKSGVTPSLTNEPSLETAFSQAYQMYNAYKDGYGNTVIANTKLFEPNPANTIFTTGGQQ